MTNNDKVSRSHADIIQKDNRYIKILNNINRSAICQGDVAKALKSYIGYASRMKKQIQEISDIAQKETDKFLSSVDDADQYIF